MKKYSIILIVLFYFIFSCKSIQEVKQQSRLLTTYPIVVSINHKLGYVTIKWDCNDRPYKNQPCYGFSDHPLYLFENIMLGDTLLLSK